MGKLKEYAAVCTIGSVGYSAIELFWRGFTHWTMGVAGAVGFLLLYLTERRMAGKTLLERCIAGCMVLTTVEFTAGCVINKLFHMDVWDYSEEQGNLLGQICPLYCILWFLLCFLVMPLSRMVRKQTVRL